MINNFLSKRESNLYHSLNPSLLAHNVVKSYYDFSKPLKKYELDHRFSSIEFSPDGNYLVSCDQKSLNLRNLNEEIQNSKYEKLVDDKGSIFHSAFNEDSTKLLYDSYINSSSSSLSLYDLATKKISQKTLFPTGIFFFSMNPKNLNNILISDSRELHCVDLRKPILKKVQIKNLEGEEFLYSFQYHPTDDNLVLSCTSNKTKLFTFDLRNNEIIMDYEIPCYYNTSFSYAIYNKKGTQILFSSLMERLILFDSSKSKPSYEFDELGYFCPDEIMFPQNQYPFCFAGLDDEYVVAGSKNYYVYTWEIPQNNVLESEQILKTVNKSKLILKGHTSAIGKTHFSYSKYFLATFSLWKELIFWSPFNVIKNSKDIRNGFSDDTNYEKDFKYIYDDLCINKFRFFGIKFKMHLEPLIVYKEKVEFFINYKEPLKIKMQTIENFLKENSSVQFIYYLIIQLQKDFKSTNSQLLEKLKQVLNENSDNGITPSIKNFSLYIESFKIIYKTVRITSCVVYLKFQLTFLKKIKTLSKKSSSEKNLNNTYLIKKKILVLNILFHDLVVFIILNKELFKVAYQTFKQVIKRFDTVFTAEEENIFLHEVFSNKIFYSENYEENNSEQENKNFKLSDDETKFLIKSDQNLSLIQFFNDDYLVNFSENLKKLQYYF